MSNDVKSLKYRDFTEIIFLTAALLVLLLVWFQWDAVTVITVFRAMYIRPKIQNRRVTLLFGQTTYGSL
jgi:hypothetical protein